MSVFTSPIKLVVPKGRMESMIIEALKERGLRFEKAASRSLFYTGVGIEIDVIPLKSPDILTYMEMGLADYAILGEDILAESASDYQTIAPLKIGECRMSLAGFPMFPLSRQKYLRIASKYPVQAAKVLKDLGIDGEVITLTSSVELAPILGFADAILDIVETGATLRDNGLVEWFPLKPIASVFIGQKDLKLSPDQRDALSTLVQALPIKVQEVGYALCG